MISGHRSRLLLAILLAAPLCFASSARAQSPDNGSGQGQGQGPGQGQGSGQGQWGGRGGQHGPMSPDDRLKQMTADLNLTADEQAAIKPILMDQQKKMDDARNDNSGGDRQAMHQKFEQIRTDANTKIRALLDDKQKAKFDQEEADREQRMQHRGGPGGGPDNGPNNGPGNGANSPPPTN